MEAVGTADSCKDDNIVTAAVAQPPQPATTQARTCDFDSDPDRLPELPSFMRKCCDDGINVHYTNTPESYFRDRAVRDRGTADAYAAREPSRRQAASTPAHENAAVTSIAKEEQEDQESNKSAMAVLKKSMVEVYKMGKETFEVAGEEEMDRFYRGVAEKLGKFPEDCKKEHPGSRMTKVVDEAELRERKEELRRLMREAKREAG